MSVFRRFSNIFQQKSNAALDRLEDPSQAIDLSYQQLLEQQQQILQQQQSILELLKSKAA